MDLFSSLIFRVLVTQKFLPFLLKWLMFMSRPMCHFFFRKMKNALLVWAAHVDDREKKKKIWLMRIWRHQSPPKKSDFLIKQRSYLHPKVASESHVFFARIKWSKRWGGEKFFYSEALFKRKGKQVTAIFRESSSLVKRSRCISEGKKRQGFVKQVLLIWHTLGDAGKSDTTRFCLFVAHPRFSFSIVALRLHSFFAGNITIFCV